MNSTFVADTLAQARTKASMLTLRAGAPSNPIFGNPSANATLATANSMNHASEQYRHYSGWVHAAIRPIAQTVAKQTLRVARLVNQQHKARVPITSKTHVFTPTGPVLRTRAAESLYLKRALPGNFKSYADRAELLEWHPILDAINNPNPIMVRWALFFATVASMQLTGKSYWWVRTEKSAQPNAPDRLEIWPLPSHWVQPKHTKEKMYAAWHVRPRGASEAFVVPPEQIVYFYTPDPSDPFGSYATLQAQARAVVAAESIAESQRQSFARGIYPGYAVVMGRLPDAQGNAGQGERPLLTKAQREQLTVAIKQMYRGVYNTDEPLILDALIQDIRRITTTNREMDYLSSAGLTKEQITQAFGTNPIVMGQVENASRNSAATAQDIFYDLAVNPIIALMSECMSAWFSGLFAGPDERLLLFLEEARATDPDSEREDYKFLAAEHAVDRNEMRAAIRNLAPIDQGDLIAVPQGITFMPLNDVRDTTLAMPLLGEMPANALFTPTATRTATVEQPLLGGTPAYSHLITETKIGVPVPVVAQIAEYDCGAACARAVAERYNMVHQWTPLDFMMALNTQDETGTAPRHIVDLFKHNGNEVRYGPHWSLGKLFNALRAGQPVICCIQGMTFGDDDARAKMDNGHWVVVDQADRDAIYYMDPFTGQHEQATWSDFEVNWQDRGQDGTPYTRYAIAVGAPPAPLFDPQTNTGNARHYATCVKRAYFCLAKTTPWLERAAARLKFFTRQEQTLYGALLKHFDAERERLATIVHDWAKRAPFDLFAVDLKMLPADDATAWPYETTKANNDEDEAMLLLDDLLPLEKTTARLVDAVASALDGVLLDAAAEEWHDLQPRDEAKAKRKPKVDRTPLPKPIRETCHEYLGRVVVQPYWEDMTYKTRLAMARAIRRGLAHGEDRAQIAKRIMRVVGPDNDKVRALLIARTEANGAVNLGQQATRNHMLALGAILTKRWVAVEDEAVRDTHAEADGQEVKAKNKFRVGKEWCDYPGAQNLTPGERCNCRCGTLTIPH